MRLGCCLLVVHVVVLSLDALIAIKNGGAKKNPKFVTVETSSSVQKIQFQITLVLVCSFFGKFPPCRITACPYHSSGQTLHKKQAESEELSTRVKKLSSEIQVCTYQYLHIHQRTKAQAVNTLHVKRGLLVSLKSTTHAFLEKPNTHGTSVPTFTVVH